MEYDKLICDLAVGDQIEGFYVLKNPQGKVTANGKPFLTAALSDRSGAIEAKCWDYAGPIGGSDDGKVIKIRGAVSEYRGALQLTIERLRLAESGDSFDRSRLVPVAPINEEECFAAVRSMVESIEDGDYRGICLQLLERKGDTFRTIPAAKSVHHSFLGGLLMHTHNMLRTADFLSRLYAPTVDRSLLMAGTLLHDFAKAEEFSFSGLGLVTDYSVKGQLLGHLVMGAREVAEIAAQHGVPEEKSVLLQHMILSHHGQPEFGAAVVPQCAESELLSLIDMIDSRMEIYQEAMEETPVGTFSKRIFALDKRIFHHD